MDTIKKLEIDLLYPQKSIPKIYIVQGDYYTRKIQVSLLSDGSPWQIPDGVIIGLRYRKPDGTTGSYDSLPSGESASTFTGNTLVLTLAPQVMTAEGCVNAQLEIVLDNAVLASFLFQIMVSHNPALPIYASQNYFNWQQWAQAQLDDHVASAAAAGLFIPSFSIGTVSTLSPGSAATAEIRGTAANPILDLGIPSGYNGEIDETFSLTGYAADAKATGAALKKAGTVNLLDNSNFRNPVNQRGESAYTTGYTIDRWTMPVSATCSVTANGIELKDGTVDHGAIIRQYLPVDATGKVMTLAVCDADGEIYIHCCTVPSGSWSSLVTEWGKIGLQQMSENLCANILVNNGFTKTLQWAALYEGEFTAETLPDYKPKGYGTELAECRRYYQHNVRVTATKMSSGLFTVCYYHGMRICPTVTLVGFYHYGYASVTDFTDCTVQIADDCVDYASLPTCQAYAAGGLHFRLSADL